MNDLAIAKTEFQLPGQKNRYQGKVRDVYNIEDKYLVMVATDRISAFDTILPRPIPYKGQVLNQIAAKFLEATGDIVPNWVVSVPDPNVTIGLKCAPIPIEMVIRGYLAGHAWRVYKSGKREICGQSLPDGLSQNDPLPEPVITPTTKAKTGHDEDISKEAILEKGLVDESTYEKLATYTRQLYKRGAEMAAQQGLILVDTKYEFGMKDGTIYLIDEVHTPDSSRYFYAEGYRERQQQGEHQKQLSKEFVREWLMKNGFQGKEGQQMPELTDTFIQSVTDRYIELYEKLTGQKFRKTSEHPTLQRIEINIKKALKVLSSSKVS